MNIYSDTICAIATATGGAIGVIRMSGEKTFDILSTIFHCNTFPPPTPPRSLHVGSIKGNEIIDNVVVSTFSKPHSYTGEDVAEISCHGSTYILNKILELLIKKGARMANPGEFTQRAYLNGKMDLSQAEAVADLIASTNRATHQMAMSQLRGHISSELARLRQQLLNLTSLLELELDFSDHEDLEFADRTQIISLTEKLESQISTLIHSFKTGQALKQGIPIAIIGKTNVGKSTLLNCLLKEDRAIVSDIHGTTRDTIEDCMDIQGVRFRFIDTAGLRETKDEVEKIGIQRTYRAIENARIILWIIDQPPTPKEVQEIKKITSNKTLLIIQNKADLKTDYSCFPSKSILQYRSTLSISAKTGQNIPELERCIYQAADISEIQESDIIISNARHYQILLQAHENITQVLRGLRSNLSGDLLAEDLRLVITNLAQISGQNQITPTEILENIFRSFCVGK